MLSVQTSQATETHRDDSTGRRLGHAELVAVGVGHRDSADLATALDTVLGNEALRGQLAAASAQVVQPYDWAVVASQILRVYEIAIAATVTD